MNHFQKSRLALALLAFGAAATLSSSHSAYAEKQSPALQKTEQRTISVTGIGEIAGNPDQAKISAGVVTEAVSASDALEQNNKNMQAIFAGLKEMGIPETNIQTSEFSIVPQYTTFKKDGPPPKILSYRVTNTVRVTVNKLTELGNYLDKFIDLGANKLNSVEFGFANIKQMQTAARQAAAGDARAKAELYAKSLGLTLGDILTVSEIAESTAPPMTVARTMDAQAMDFVPVAPGQQKITAQLSVIFAIQD